MTEPTFDADGYPSDETIKSIEKWPVEDFKNCLNFAEKVYHKGYGVWDRQNGYIKIATGGWSGNEDIVHALNKQLYWNVLFIACTSGGTWYIKDPENYYDYDISCNVEMKSFKKKN